MCVLLQAAEMVEDEVDPDSQSWGGMRGEIETLSDVKVLAFKLEQCLRVLFWVICFTAEGQTEVNYISLHSDQKVKNHLENKLQIDQ